MGDDERRARVREDVADAVGRMVRVERHVGRAGLEQPEQRHIGLDAAVEQHADPVAGLDAAGAEGTAPSGSRARRARGS